VKLWEDTSIDNATGANDMTAKQITRYEIREFIGNEYSKQLGRRLRTREQAGRIVRLLKKQGRTVFSSPLKIAA
jgi:hypothetical protein